MVAQVSKSRWSGYRLTWLTVTLWLAVSGMLVLGMLHMRHSVRDEVRVRMIDHTAVILQPLVQDQVDLALAVNPELPRNTRMVSALVAHARQQGLLSMAVFDADGLALDSVPAGGALVELSMGDFLQLQTGNPISRYDPLFELARLSQTANGGLERRSPVLEVVLPLREKGRTELAGFVRYQFDARPLASELAEIDGQMHKQTLTVIGIGLLVVTGVFAVAYIGLRRTQAVIARSTANLARAESNLTLSTKASALGQITSHLMHGLQDSVAGLQAAVGDSHHRPDWGAAQEYTKRVQSMVRETVELLNDRRSALAYELSGDDLAEILRQRHAASAEKRQVVLSVTNRFAGQLDNVRGNLVGLILGNVVDNAIAATPAGQSVQVSLQVETTSNTLQADVVDSGSGMPAALCEHLFEPGCSGRPGGTGLGLALSRLLARQIDGDLTLIATSAAGSHFRLTVPLSAQRTAIDMEKAGASGSHK